MKRDVSIYLKDMIENMGYAEEFTRGISYDHFIEDTKLHYAVIRCVEVIGEAAKHVPNSIRKKYPQVPWKDIAGMRDKVIHFYFGVNLERVWLAVKDDIAEIKPSIERILKDLQRE